MLFESKVEWKCGGSWLVVVQDSNKTLAWLSILTRLGFLFLLFRRSYAYYYILDEV